MSRVTKIPYKDQDGIATHAAIRLLQWLDQAATPDITDVEIVARAYLNRNNNSKKGQEVAPRQEQSADASGTDVPSAGLQTIAPATPADVVPPTPQAQTPNVGGTPSLGSAPLGAEVKPKIFVFINGGRGTDWVSGMALAEDGHCLAGHVSSSDHWFQHDMGLRGDWKHDEYKAHYPDGYELVHVENPRDHEGLAAAYAKNQELADTAEPLEAN